MTYQDARPNIKTGDILLVQGSAFFSKIIRTLTGESFSHVALLHWRDDGLWVAEFVEGTGYQLMPASQWMAGRVKDTVFWGVAPKVVQADPADILKLIDSYRADKSKQGYGYLSLFTVLWAQITGKDYKPAQKVCSTFVQAAWESTGYHFNQTADPGDYLDLCQAIQPITA